MIPGPGGASVARRRVLRHRRPNDQRLPTAGQQVCGLYDVSAAARPNLAINRLVALIEPNTLYGDRLNQTDLRFARIFNYGRYRLQGMIDIYNVFNRSPVLAYNTTFGQEWLRPTDVLQGRLVKIGGQLTF